MTKFISKHAESEVLLFANYSNCSISSWNIPGEKMEVVVRVI